MLRHTAPSRSARRPQPLLGASADTEAPSPRARAFSHSFQHLRKAELVGHESQRRYTPGAPGPTRARAHAIHTHPQLQAHTHTRTHTRACTHKVHTHIRSCKHTRANAHTPADASTHTPARAHTHKHTHIRSLNHTRAHILSCKHTCVHAHTRARAHTHAYTSAAVSARAHTHTRIRGASARAHTRQHRGRTSTLPTSADLRPTLTQARLPLTAGSAPEPAEGGGAGLSLAGRTHRLSVPRGHKGHGEDARG